MLLFCAILIFGLLPITASADTALISSAPMTAYFETYTSGGVWTDLQTPAHWITATGEVAYCLQTSKDNPYNAGYYTIDGEEVYSARVLTGLQAILDHGYFQMKKRAMRPRMRSDSGWPKMARTVYRSTST